MSADHTCESNILGLVMCSSGAHYIDHEELEELNRRYKEENEGTPPKYICSYSGLPSLLIYQNEK